MVVVVVAAAVEVGAVAAVAQAAGAVVAAEAEVAVAPEVTEVSLEERNASNLMMTIISRIDQSLGHVLNRDLAPDLSPDPVDHAQDQDLVLALAQDLVDQGRDLESQDPVHQVAADLARDPSRAQKAVLAPVHGLHLNQAIKFVILLVFRSLLVVLIQIY